MALLGTALSPITKVFHLSQHWLGHDKLENVSNLFFNLTFGVFGCLFCSHNNEIMIQYAGTEKLTLLFT